MSKESDKKIKNKNSGLLKKYNIKWVFLITIWTFILATSVSMISEIVLRNFEILFAFTSLISIVIIGVFFDIIGTAVTSSNERPFHSMAANKIKEAKYATNMVRNAGRVSNFCNDVIGDVSGIISGAAGSIIVLKLVNEYGLKDGTLLSIIMSGIIASITVGGKAIGKEIAIRKSEKIVFYTAKVFMVIDIKLGIDILSERRKKKNI